jgi:hypothetical protein
MFSMSHTGLGKNAKERGEPGSPRWWWADGTSAGDCRLTALGEEPSRSVHRSAEWSAATIDHRYSVSRCEATCSGYWSAMCIPLADRLKRTPPVCECNLTTTPFSFLSQAIEPPSTTVKPAVAAEKLPLRSAGLVRL